MSLEPKTPETIIPNLTPKLSLKKTPKIWLWVLLGLVFVALLGAGLAYFWYQDALKPLSDDANAKAFTVGQNESVSVIAKKLNEESLIKNPLAFEIYNRLNGTSGQLRTGTYLLKPNMSIEEIVKLLITGKTEQKVVTFYPGSTLNFRHNDRDKTLTHREALKSAGFSDEEIDSAFAKVYADHPLFKLLPGVEDLEGLIYGDTFYYAIDASLESVLRYNFDHYYKVINDNGLVDKYKEQGLELYQGIILASIIEREALSKADRAQVSQVFLKRYREGMKLGSDVTYQYICRLLGVPNNYQIDSPYNTRRYEGLPPTPIATPSLSSLLAVANPAEGDYVYFLAGDDGVTYFAYTYAEHERNIRDHCKIGCSVQ